LYRWSIFSCALEIPADSATQPQKASVSSAASAFQGFAFGFICVYLRKSAANGLARLRLFNQNR